MQPTFFVSVEIFLKFKERYYFETDNRRDKEKAAALLAEAIASTNDVLYKTTKD